MTITEKHIAYENNCRQMFVGQTIRAVIYGELKYFANEDRNNIDPEPYFNTKYTDIDTLDLPIMLSRQYSASHRTAVSLTVFNLKKMNCKNCGHKINGKFCSNCGQNSKVGSINLATVLNELSEGIFQINKGFFYTLSALFTRPGKSLKEFLDGRRKDHFKPIAYVLTLSTLYFLITQVTNQNTWIADGIRGWMNGAIERNSEADVPKMASWFAKNYAYTTLILLPLFSFASYLSFYKSGKNYLEHIVINSYITGQQAILYSLFAIGATLIEGSLIEALSLLVAISYTFWVFWQLFSAGNRMMNILRSIMTYILYLIFSLVFLLALMGINEI